MDEDPVYVRHGNILDASIEFKLKEADHRLQKARERLFRERDRIAKNTVKNNERYLNQLSTYLNDPHDACKMEILLELRRFRSDPTHSGVTSLAIEYDPHQEINTVFEYLLAEIGYLVMDPPSEDAHKEAEGVIKRFFESPVFRKQNVAVFKDEKGALRLGWKTKE